MNFVRFRHLVLASWLEKVALVGVAHTAKEETEGAIPPAAITPRVEKSGMNVRY